MADATYDVVIAGAGTKALTLGLYLNKFGGMRVAMFERRHEAGGGMAGEETPAPGFVGHIHAVLAGGTDIYWKTVFRDFPDEAAEYGLAKPTPMRHPNGIIFQDDPEKNLVVTGPELDPTQEKTAAQIARFSQKDADRWLRYAEPGKVRKALDALEIMMFNPPSLKHNPLRAFLADADLEWDPSWSAQSWAHQARDLWESPEMRAFWVALPTSGGNDPFESGIASSPYFVVALTFDLGTFGKGNVHHNAHALIKMNLALGNKIFTNCEVDKLVIENGEAKGLRLVDGTEVCAKQMVVTNVDPATLAHRFIGRENLSDRICRKIDGLERDYVCLTWYNWALHELPKYDSAAWNPDVNDVGWLAIHHRDITNLRNRDLCRKMGYLPVDAQGNTILNLCIGNTLTEGSPGHGVLAPDGKATLLTEQFIWPANYPGWDEERWLRFKRRHAEDVMRVMGNAASNMTWGNVIGYDPETPWDIANHLHNMGPQGNWRIIDGPLSQTGPFRPILEWSRHKVPEIRGLYCTGSAWHPAGYAWSCEGYNAYKVIAEDFALRKPWEELGAPF